MDWVITFGTFGLLVAVSASPGWWLPIAPVGLIDFAAVISWFAAASRPEPKPWEDPLPDFGPLLWAVLAMAVTLAATIGWTVRLYRTGRRPQAAMLLGLGVLPIIGLWVAAAT